MRKERDRIVAWLLTFMMVFIMAVGSGRVIFADGEDAAADVIAEEAAESSEESMENAEIAESGEDSDGKIESVESNEGLDGQTESAESGEDPDGQTETAEGNEDPNGQAGSAESDEDTDNQTETTERSEEQGGSEEAVESTVDSGAETESAETDETTDDSEEREPEEIVPEESMSEGTEPEENVIPLDVTVTVKDKQYDGTTDGELEGITVSAAEEAGETFFHDIRSLTENPTEFIEVNEITFDQADVGTDLAVTYTLAWTEAAEAAGYDTICALPETTDGTYSTTATISRAVIWLSFSDLTCEYQAVPDGITDGEMSVSWPSAAGSAIDISIREYTFGGPVTESLKAEAQAVLDAYEKPELVLLRSELDEDGDGLHPGLDIGSYENVVGLSGLTVAEKDLTKNTESSFLNIDVTVEGTTNSNYQLRVAEAEDFGDIVIEQDGTAYSLDDLDVEPGENIFVDEAHDTVYVKQGTVLFVEGNKMYPRKWTQEFV